MPTTDSASSQLSQPANDSIEQYKIIYDSALRALDAGAPGLSVQIRMAIATSTALHAMSALRPPEVSREGLLAQAQAFVDRKYVARSDARQKSMGLAYVEAERQDLAREIANFCFIELYNKSMAELESIIG